jgi:hypothetical protein
MAKTAADVINQVRDLIPDPVYDAAGVALPGTDGDLFRTQTLLRFIDDIVKSTAQRTGWSVHDWFAMARVNGKPYYAIDEKWIDVHEAFSNMWPLDRISEGGTISPTHPSARPLWYGIHNRGAQLEAMFFPRPNVSDPATTLDGAINATVTTITLASVTDFYNPFGFAQIENEIIQYERMDTVAKQLLTVSRGRCGTTAASHANAVAVTHLGLWVKGPRLPLDVTATTSTIELPLAMQFMVEMGVLARCRRAENDDQSAQTYLDEYDKEMKRILEDPRWRQIELAQSLPYGATASGPLAFGRIILP